MKSIHLAGLALVAVLAVTAMAATTAFAAAPEFKPSTLQTLTGTVGTGLLTTSADSVKCSGGSNTGEINGAKTVGKVVVTFTGCVESAGGAQCTIKSTNTSTAGDIVTNTLKGELGTSKEATNGVALILEPETTKKFTTLAATTCFAETAVAGSVAGEATPTGKSQTTGKLIFAATTKGSPKTRISKFNGKTVELEAFGKEASEETEDAVTFTSAVEIS